MSHALIIDDNMIVSRAIEQSLTTLGFTSFDRAWTEEQAVTAAMDRPPDLVIIGDSIEVGSSVNAARRISAGHEVPVLMVTGDSFRARDGIPKDATLEGPFHFNDIETVVTLAGEFG